MCLVTLAQWALWHNQDGSQDHFLGCFELISGANRGFLFATVFQYLRMNTAFTTYEVDLLEFTDPWSRHIMFFCYCKQINRCPFQKIFIWSLWSGMRFFQLLLEHTRCASGLDIIAKEWSFPIPFNPWQTGGFQLLPLPNRYRERVYWDLLQTCARKSGELIIRTKNRLNDHFCFRHFWFYYITPDTSDS